MTKSRKLYKFFLKLNAFIDTFFTYQSRKTLK